MNVLIIPAWYPTPKNKMAGIFVQDQVQSLIKQNVNVKVIYSQPYEKIKNTNSIVYYSKYSVIINKQFSFINYFSNVYKSFLQLKKNGFIPDIIHAHVSLPSGLAAVLLKKQFKIPVILTEHTSPFEYLMRNPLSAFLTRFTINHSDAVIAVSNRARDDMLKYNFNKDIKVIHNMVNLSEFNLRPKRRNERNKIRLLFVGGLNTDQKGLDLLLKAFQKIRQNPCFFSMDLVVVGGGEKLDYYKNFAVDLGLGESVIFKGALDRKGVIEEMQACDVFVLPSRHETFGVVIIEALASGKPVVSTRCGGPEDIIKEEFLGELANREDVDDLASKITKVITNLDKYDSKKIREYVKDCFGSEIIAKKLIAEYKKLI